MDEKDLEHRLTEVEARSKSNTHRLDNLDDLVKAVHVLAVREEAMENDVKEIKEDVKTLTNKPGKMWDSLIEKITLTIAATLVGYILAQLGIG